MVPLTPGTRGMPLRCEDRSLICLLPTIDAALLWYAFGAPRTARERVVARELVAFKLRFVRVSCESVYHAHVLSSLAD